MRTLRSKLIVLLIFAALMPLLLSQALSLYHAEKALKKSIRDSYREIAFRTAGEISLYFDHIRSLFETLVVDLADTHLTPQQSERIIENYIIRFPQVRKILIFSEDKKLHFSTSLKKNDHDLPPKDLLALALQEQKFFSDTYLSDELVPVIWYLLPMKASNQVTGVVAVQIDLLLMWQLSEDKLGKEGYVSIVDGQGKLVASGDPFYKRAMLVSEHAVYVEEFNRQRISEFPTDFGTSRGRFLVSSLKIDKSPGWYLVLSQPHQEAFAMLSLMRIELGALTIAAVILMALLGMWGSWAFLLKPVRGLVRATHELAAGHLDYRVPTLGHDELSHLGESFNQMGVSLAQLQETIRKQERLTMFGRVAAGLVHDLKHPVKNIENAARLMEELYEDADYRSSFTRIVQREFERINRFLDDLRNLTQDMPYHPRVFDLVSSLKEVVENFHTRAQSQGTHLTFESSEAQLSVYGDPFLLKRLFENLLANACEAIFNQGGQIRVDLRQKDEFIQVRVSDTGTGIPSERIPKLFDEFVTTKHRGLGLGLPIIKKIVDLHQGTIEVQSDLGKGTTFCVTLDRSFKAAPADKAESFES